MRSLTMEEVEFVSGGSASEIITVWGHRPGAGGGIVSGSSGTAGSEGGGDTVYAQVKYNVNINIDADALLERLTNIYKDVVSKTNNSVANFFYNSLYNSTKNAVAHGNTVTTYGLSTDGHWYFLDDIGHDRDWEAVRRMDAKTGFKEVWANGGWHPYDY